MKSGSQARIDPQHVVHDVEIAGGGGDVAEGMEGGEAAMDRHDILRDQPVRDRGEREVAVAAELPGTPFSGRSSSVPSPSRRPVSIEKCDVGVKSWKR
jgi:hypothetical protein